MPLNLAAQGVPALKSRRSPTEAWMGHKRHAAAATCPRPFAAGGDALIMICLWQLGVAVSDPGFSFYHSDLRMFDSPSAEGRHLLYALTEALAKRCDPSCQVRCIVPLQGQSMLLPKTCAVAGHL